jgi:hypothetical protein
VSTTPATPAETGEIVLTWGPDGPAVTAPDRAAVPVWELFGMRRVPGDPRAVELPGGVRYLIGAAHRRWRGAVYLIACRNEPPGGWSATARPENHCRSVTARLGSERQDLDVLGVGSGAQRQSAQHPGEQQVPESQAYSQ